MSKTRKLPKCPRCGADPKERVACGGMGGPTHDACKKCGYEWPVEESRG